MCWCGPCNPTRGQILVRTFMTSVPKYVCIATGAPCLSVRPGPLPRGAALALHSLFCHRPRSIPLAPVAPSTFCHSLQTVNESSSLTLLTITRASDNTYLSVTVVNQSIRAGARSCGLFARLLRPRRTISRLSLLIKRLFAHIHLLLLSQHQVVEHFLQPCMRAAQHMHTVSHRSPRNTQHLPLKTPTHRRPRGQQRVRARARTRPPHGP